MRHKWRAVVVACATIGAMALSAHPSYAAEAPTSSSALTQYEALSSSVVQSADFVSLLTDVRDWATGQGINPSPQALHVTDLRFTTSRPANSDLDNIASAYQEALASALTPQTSSTGSAHYNALVALVNAHPQALTDLRSLALSPVTHAYAVASLQQLVVTNGMSTTTLLNEKGVNLGYAPLVFTDDPSGLLSRFALVLGTYSTQAVPPPCTNPTCYDSFAGDFYNLIVSIVEFLQSLNVNMPECLNTATTTFGSGGLYGIVVRGVGQVTCHTSEPTYFYVFATLYWINSPYGVNGYNVGSSNSCPGVNYCSATVTSNIAQPGAFSYWQTESQFSKGNDSAAIPYPAYSPVCIVF